MKKDLIYDLIEKFPERIKDAYQTEVIKSKNKYKRIIIYGMGGCYIAGLLIKEILRESIEIEVFPGYEYMHIKNSDLIVLLSYSGETSEILILFHNLLKLNKNNLLIMTSGGKLLEESIKNKISHIEIKSDLNQRFTFPYIFFPLYKFLEQSNQINKGIINIPSLVNILKTEKTHIINDSIKLSKLLLKKYPLIYASNYFYPCNYRMQTSLEEDAKLLSHSNRITELFHNELEAIPDRNFYPIILFDGNETMQYIDQINYFKKRLKDFYEFPFYNYSKEIRAFLFFYLADYLGFYLSKIKKTEMSKTPVSDEIKRL